MEPILANTPIKISDSASFFQLIQDKDIRQEFINLRSINSVEEAQTFLKHQVENTSTKRFFKAIRIGFNEDADSWTSDNSILIGFISLHDAGLMDSFLTGGFHQNLSFAIETQYGNRGIMTTSLNMLLQAMIADEYNVVPALVKPNNAASEKVLIKCGFDKVRESPMGTLYVRRLTMNEFEYKKAMSLA
jgi:RimJ/RimL family protein N-acetyltransferase